MLDKYAFAKVTKRKNVYTYQKVDSNFLLYFKDYKEEWSRQQRKECKKTTHVSNGKMATKKTNLVLQEQVGTGKKNNP